MLLNNISCKRKLNNGTPVTYHSLILDPRDDGPHIDDLIAHAAAGKDLYWEYPPLWVNVIAEQADLEEFVDLTLQPGQAVIPVAPMHGAKNFKLQCTVQNRHWT